MDNASGRSPAAGGWVAGIAAALVLAASVCMAPAASADPNNPAAPDAPQGPSHAEPRPAPAAPAAAKTLTLQLPIGSIDWEYSSFGVYGPTFKSADGKDKLTMGLFVWFDNTVVTNDELRKPLGKNKLSGDSRIGTARFEMHGTYTDYFYYYFRVDFQDNGTGSGHSAVEWAALGVQGVPWIPNLLIGLQQPIYALDIWANYPRHRLMLEPSLINAFYKGPLLGITAYDVSMANHYSWGLGVARDTSDQRAQGLQAVSHGQDDFILHGRFGWFPRYQDAGRHLLFFGLSGAYIRPKNHTITYGIWPETFTDDVNRYALATVDNLDRSIIGVLEFRAAEGPAWIQSDYLRNWNRRSNAPDLNFGAWYVEGGYFLTGEQTVFSPLALNGPVSPTPIFDPRNAKWGAVELQARYSRLNMTDGDFRGGGAGPPFTHGASVHDITFGVNWFLNAHIKSGIDYVHSMRSDLGNARYDVIEARLAWCL